MDINKLYIQKYSDSLAVIIISLIILTSITPQQIAVDFAWIKSDYDVLKDLVLGNNSLLSKSIILFGQFNLNMISIIYSIVMNITSVLGLFLFAYYYKLKLHDICIVICLIFFIDHLNIYSAGLNYPLSLLEVSQNTSGQIGFAFSILTIATFHINTKVGAPFLLLNLLIHPTLGLLTSSYLCLQFLLRKNLVGFILPLSISTVFIFINLHHLQIDKNHVVDFIYTIDIHRRAINFIDLKFLLIPAVFTILISDKKSLIAEWLFIISCLIVSGLYYNLKIEFLQYEFLALMPSRGVNLGMAIIIIKYCVDVVNNPNLKKLISLFVLSFIFTSYPIISKPFMVFISGLVILIAYSYSGIFIGIKEKPDLLWKLIRDHSLLFIIVVILVINIKTSSNTIKSREYDQFINSKNGFVLDFTNDYRIMVRNINIIELLPMPLMDGYSYNPYGLVRANNLFKKIFTINLWDLEIENKCGCILYVDIKHLIENFSQDDFENAKTLGLQYIIAPASSKIPLKIIWNNEKYIIYEIT
jgi:hypothetical protein